MLKLGSTFESILGFLGKSPQQQASDTGWNIGRLDDLGAYIGLAHRLQHCHLAVTGEEPLTCQHLVEQGAQGEDVRTVIDRFAPRLLR